MGRVTPCHCWGRAELCVWGLAGVKKFGYDDVCTLITFGPAGNGGGAVKNLGRDCEKCSLLTRWVRFEIIVLAQAVVHVLNVTKSGFLLT